VGGAPACSEAPPGGASRSGRLPEGRQVAGGGHRVGREAVHLGLVEQQEEGAGAADPVSLVAQVELGAVHPGPVQLAQALVGPGLQLVELPELDRLGRAGVRAGRFQVVPEPVVAERALPRPAVVLAPVDDPERAGGHAVPAAVADVRLDHDRAELGAEQGAGRADLEAGR
jgi:hypothetical protein